LVANEAALPILSKIAGVEIKARAVGSFLLPMPNRGVHIKVVVAVPAKPKKVGFALFYAGGDPRAQPRKVFDGVPGTCVKIAVGREVPGATVVEDGTIDEIAERVTSLFRARLLSALPDCADRIPLP
jgi:hypothetical protein